MSRSATVTSSITDFVHGFVGVGTPLFAVITSMQEQFEWGLRVASLLIGIVVGLLSAWSIARRIRKQ